MTSQQTTLKSNVFFFATLQEIVDTLLEVFEEAVEVTGKSPGRCFLWFGSTQVTSKAEKRHVRLGNTLVTGMMNKNHQLVGFIHVYDLFGR